MTTQLPPLQIAIAAALSEGREYEFTQIIDHLSAPIETQIEQAWDTHQAAATALFDGLFGTIEHGSPEYHARHAEVKELANYASSLENKNWAVTA